MSCMKSTYAAELVNQPKSSLLNPLLVQNLETLARSEPRTISQFQVTKSAKLQPSLNQSRQITNRGANDLHSAIHRHEQLHYALGGVAVLNCGRCNHNRQEQRHAVHGDMTFAAHQFFTCVGAARSRLVGCFNGLAVHDSCGCCHLSFLGLAHTLVVRLFPCRTWEPVRATWCSLILHRSDQLDNG